MNKILLILIVVLSACSSQSSNVVFDKRSYFGDVVVDKHYKESYSSGDNTYYLTLADSNVFYQIEVPQTIYIVYRINDTIK